ncbi:MAG: Uncharacterised protein [Methanobacteriota archaeon]|nr:MAG: Uncharacterised protein [Euryarchaeota archaeon]
MDATPLAAAAATPIPTPIAVPATAPTILPLATNAPPSPSSSTVLIGISSPIRIHSGGVLEPPPSTARVVNAANGITASAVSKSRNDVSGTFPILNDPSIKLCSICKC